MWPASNDFHSKRKKHTAGLTHLWSTPRAIRQLARMAKAATDQLVRDLMVEMGASMVGWASAAHDFTTEQE